jgi:hypothetical protein
MGGTAVPAAVCGLVGSAVGDAGPAVSAVGGLIGIGGSAAAAEGLSIPAPSAGVSTFSPPAVVCSRSCCSSLSRFLSCAFNGSRSA